MTSSGTAGEDSKVLTFDAKMQTKCNHTSYSAQEQDGDAEHQKSPNGSD